MDKLTDRQTRQVDYHFILHPDWYFTSTTRSLEAGYWILATALLLPAICGGGEPAILQSRQTRLLSVSYQVDRVLPRQQGSWGQHGAHLGPVSPRWASCWSHEPCYQGTHNTPWLLLCLLLLCLYYQSLVNLHVVFTHIRCSYFTGTGAIIW